MSVILEFGAYNCDLSNDEQRVKIKNIGTSNLTVLPDTLEVQLVSGGWTEVDSLPDGCPVPLPPGQACAIVGDISGLPANDSYTWVRVSWSGGEHDEMTARLKDECQL